jgi:hypothetical protein
MQLLNKAALFDSAITAPEMAALFEVSYASDCPVSVCVRWSWPTSFIVAHVSIAQRYANGEGLDFEAFPCIIADIAVRKFPDGKPLVQAQLAFSTPLASPCPFPVFLCSQTSRQRILCSYLIPLFNRRTAEADPAGDAPPAGRAADARAAERTELTSHAVRNSAPSGSEAIGDRRPPREVVAVPSAEAEELAEPGFEDYNDDDYYSADEVGVIIMSILIYVTTACSKRTRATASVEHRRREPAKAISPERLECAPVLFARARTLYWKELVEKPSL